MALSPIYRDFCDELEHFHSHFFDDCWHDLHSIFPFRWRHPFCSQYYDCCSKDAVKRCRERSCCPRVSIDKSGFEMSMNVKRFEPDEITVKTLDNIVQIEGKHKERNDKQGYVARHFVRRYTLPRGYDPEQVMSTLSQDGVLTVKAPAPESIPEIAERIVPVQQMAIDGGASNK